MILDRDPYCRYCGVELRLDGSTLDHIIPKSRGGISIPSNRVLCCRGCQRRKGDRTPSELLEWAQRIVEAAEGVECARAEEV